MAYLRAEQEADGSWFGRWGTNYIYGTWSVLTAFAQAGVGRQDPAVRRAVDWLLDRQNADGGWGESNDSYLKNARGGGRGREHALSHRVGLAGPVGVRRGEFRCGPPRRESSLAHAAGGRPVDRCEFHRARLSASVLPQVSRILQLLPALGAGRVPNADSSRYPH